MALSVCARPHFYFEEVTFDIVTSYLNGFYAGLELGKLPQSKDSRVVPPSEWDTFLEWLQQQAGCINAIKGENNNSLDSIKLIQNLIIKYLSV